MEPTDVLDGGTVVVSETTYAVLRAERSHPDAFATIRDENETTVVLAEDALEETDASGVERGWRRLTFDVVLPFELVGFLGTVASALAAADVSIFALSAYSTDHVLVRQEDLDAAVRTLEGLGCRVER